MLVARDSFYKSAGRERFHTAKTRNRHPLTPSPTSQPA